MKQRDLGNEAFTVGEVGLGCWQFGGDFGDMSEDQAMAVLRKAVERGVTFLDTADVYGAGRSEEIIGRFLKETSASVTVATKFGRGGGVFPDQYTEASLRQSIHESSERLGVETIDLLQLHCIPTAELRKGEVFEWLRRAQKDGLIRQFGASVETVEEGLVCLEQEGLASLQVIFNCFRQKLATDLLPQANERGVGIIVRLPLASGLLTGKFTQDTTFAATDHRNYNRDGACFNVGETFAGIPFDEGVQLAERIKQYVPGGMTLAQFALRWILDHNAVSVIIPGASSPEQAEGNIRASECPPLPTSLHSDLSTFYKEQVHEHIRGPY